MKNESKDLNQEFWGKPISVYTSKQAEKDGVFWDVDIITAVTIPKNFFLKYITSNLMAQGYEKTDGSLNAANLLDLLQQLSRIFKKKKVDDYFVSGRIELPSSHKQKVFIAQNETGRYTAMLPEDY